MQLVRSYGHCEGSQIRRKDLRDAGGMDEEMQMGSTRWVLWEVGGKSSPRAQKLKEV